MEYKVPDDLLYIEDHDWAKVEGDVATFGITDYAQSALSDIVYVELPEVGQTVEKGTSYGTVEAVKAVLEEPLDGLRLQCFTLAYGGRSVDHAHVFCASLAGWANRYDSTTSTTKSA